LPIPATSGQYATLPGGRQPATLDEVYEAFVVNAPFRPRREVIFRALTFYIDATMLLDGGTTPSATAKWLGHDPAITLQVYGHVYDYALASADDALLGRSRASNVE
jgi:hypothetical protein